MALVSLRPSQRQQRSKHPLCLTGDRRLFLFRKAGVDPLSRRIHDSPSYQRPERTVGGAHRSTPAQTRWPSLTGRRKDIILPIGYITIRLP